MNMKTKQNPPRLTNIFPDSATSISVRLDIGTPRFHNVNIMCKSAVLEKNNKVTAYCLQRSFIIQFEHNNHTMHYSQASLIATNYCLCPKQISLSVQ